MAAFGRRWVLVEQRLGARRAVEQFPAAIGAAFVHVFCTIRTKCAFEGADKGTTNMGGQVCAAAFTIGPHLEHQAAAFWTASQMASTSRVT